MKTINNTPGKLNKSVLIINLLTILIAGFFSIFLVGEGIPDLIYTRNPELMLFFPAMVLTILAFLVSLTGNKMALQAEIAFSILTYAVLLYWNHHMWICLMFSLPFLINGLLRLLIMHKSD